jgi:hypothetical protein
MGFFSDLWEGIKTPFRWAYDKVVNPLFNTISSGYDQIKGFIPAPLRAITDTIQSTGKQVQSGIGTARDVLGAVGLQKGGMITRDMAREAEPYALKKHFQA